jgi:hypothetical protein
MRPRRGYVPAQIAIRLQPSLKAWLDRRADLEETSVSTLVRSWIAREAKQDLQGGEVRDGDLPVASDE